ncbi:MAG: PilN domain-containing protein [Hyphomicrobiales bacterium]|nr:PilN domain-containing protein [Hyphomicrobiales bacterium]MBV8825762.1 PilN domain-containing protein [Hyphomicrobiales bacterium]
MREFLALFPAPVAQWLVGRGDAGLVLAAEADEIVLRLLAGGQRESASRRLARTDYTPAAVEKFLQEHKLTRADVTLGIRLPRAQVFCRSFTLPRQAIASLDRIVEQDLVAKTPFRRDEIYCGYAAARMGGDKLFVRQWVARRDVVEAAVSDLALGLDAVTFVDTEPEPDAGAARIPLRSERGDHGRWVGRAATGLAASAVLLAILAAGLTYWRQASALDELDSHVTAARAKAQQVRATIDKLEQKQATVLRLRTRKTEEPGLLDAWEEASRVLPSHSWLTELRLSETSDKRQISMTGFSVAAASLVGMIDQSPFFTDTALTAPIALDTVEQREHFALQARLKRPEPIRRASR